MVQHLTMNTVLHAAFRRDVARFDHALASFPAGSQARADDLKRAWDFLDVELHDHHGFEEERIWPALAKAGADCSAVAELDGEHAAMRTALATATKAMSELHASPTAENAAAAQHAVSEFGAVLTAHLGHEERDFEPIMASYWKRPEMKAVEKEIVKSLKGRMGVTFAWLQDGADVETKKFMRTQIPAPVINIATALGGRKYRREIQSIWG